MSSTRTLWDDGRRSGRQVVALASAATALVVAMDVLLSQELTLFFDLCFITVCLVAVFSVHRRDFFVLGVLPPLLMFTTVGVVALLFREAVADPVDGLVQAVVSGLAHHAGALLVGYGIVLGVLALRQVAALHLRPAVPQHRRPAPVVRREQAPPRRGSMADAAS